MLVAVDDVVLRQREIAHDGEFVLNDVLDVLHAHDAVLSLALGDDGVGDSSYVAIGNPILRVDFRVCQGDSVDDLLALELDLCPTSLHDFHQRTHSSYISIAVRLNGIYSASNIRPAII